ncbi:Haloacid dehalogenase-like hydrolase (HAD superfamily) [Bifidobacterium margollesii]|uniref:Haloacid dehalogenase-like hydrolase (HAD superfamily) n=1 Tax=Bifidobacterium margollesii TaxID=2020964 RepID=A0A2N5J8L8_9BIFI|nr:HAD-IIA family hydrolase [Bifidobacterium margollesii]PLS30559.1 Haloacid dehalogenase-like hydrolase (HAD superfamily) [Bifidobacterium margollesii]
MTRFLKGTERPISEAYRLALLDLDGVVYRGKNPVEHAADSIRQAEQAGMAMEYTTNNSSRFQAVVAEQLRGFGLDVEPWQVITSSVVAARMVAHHVPAGAKVLAAGAPHLREEITKAGLTLVDHVEDEPVAVIQGWYPEITWNELAAVAFAAQRGAMFLVTNRDLTIPRELGIAPGCGSLVNAVIEAVGYQPVASAGKPESAMYDEARQLVADAQAEAGRNGVEPVAQELCIAIGDRLDTDIEAGNRGGYDSLVVLTGVASANSLIVAEPILRPSFIAKDLRGLNVAHPAPVRQPDGSWRCVDACARLADDALVVEESGDAESALDSLDALRAACCAVWEAMDAGANADELTIPEFRI